MYKSSFLVAVRATGISHGATSVNDQPAIALTLSEAQPLFVSQNRGLIAPRRALEGAQADRLAAGHRLNPVRF